MTLIEEDLLSALKELYEVSKSMTNSNVTSAEDMERYKRTLTWAERVIKLAGEEE